MEYPVTLLLTLHVILSRTTILCYGYPHPEKTDFQPQESRHDPFKDDNGFYPSFSPFQNPPLGHSRPFYYQQEAAYSQRPQSGYQQQQVAYDSPKYSGYKDDGYQAAANSDTHGLLGSGNFGVIRGGTFYDPDATKESSRYEEDRDYSGYFGNGHGRPSDSYRSGYGGVPNTRPHQHEQFANFRDFADINTPPNSAYSQFVVVYVNKNGTHEKIEGDNNNKQEWPKNIIESLALLDFEGGNAGEVPQKKLSKSKAKLALVPREKKIRYPKKGDRSIYKSSRESSEPLLALS